MITTAQKLEWLGMQGTRLIAAYRKAVSKADLPEIERCINEYDIVCALMTDNGLVPDNRIEKAARNMYKRKGGANG